MSILSPPYTWRSFGGPIMLVTAHSGAKVVLAAESRSNILTCDDRGVLVPITADHPVAQFIEKACNAYHENMAAAEQWRLLNLIRADEGASVTLVCDNPDFNGQPNCKVICNSYWTDWHDRYFNHDTVLGALRDALTAKTAFDDAPEPPDHVHIETDKGYWRPGACGYTATLEDAGVWDRAGAAVIIGNLGPEKQARLIPVKGKK